MTNSLGIIIIIVVVLLLMSVVDNGVNMFKENPLQSTTHTSKKIIQVGKDVIDEFKKDTPINST